VQCVGDRRWRIGIADPLHPGRLALVVAGRDFAVATSGIAERGAHIIDPHTGRPAAGLASITVVGARLAEADAYATAAFRHGGGGPGLGGGPGRARGVRHHRGRRDLADQRLRPYLG
jgi:thiamine biosynthesis lipoprotein ApbE